MKNRKNELRLEVGNEVVNLICPSNIYMKSMEEYFQVESSDCEPDITIRLTIVPHEDRPKIPDSCFTNKKMNSDGFTIGTDLVIYKRGKDKKSGNLTVKSVLTKVPYTRIFEQILYQACYQSINNNKKRAYLIHSSGVIANGNGYLFTGASGRGKTTVAELSAGFHVLNDEINILEFDDTGAPWLIGTPFNGFYKNKKPGKALCKAIFLLNHGDMHDIKDPAGTYAVKTIMKEIVPPIGLDECIGQTTLLRLFDIATEIAHVIPVFDMYFKKDPGFWDVITEKMKELNHARQ